MDPTLHRWRFLEPDSRLCLRFWRHRNPDLRPNPPRERLLLRPRRRFHQPPPPRRRPGLGTTPPFHALAAYDLHSHRRIFLSLLPSSTDDDGTRHIANDVALDIDGNAYVTNSAGNFIWKVNSRGEASIFSKSPIYSSHPVDRDLPFSFCGLNGIVYSSDGFFLVVQSNTGKMYKVDAGDGTARLVGLPEDLTMGYGIVMRKDGVVVVVSQHKAWFLKSEDGWEKGFVYDKTDLDQDAFPTSVVIGTKTVVFRESQLPESLSWQWTSLRFGGGGGSGEVGSRRGGSRGERRRGGGGGVPRARKRLAEVERARMEFRGS